ncbi:hypothetical protein Pmar_PMAR001252 [Perkinsus marinus ATCC 50983]|uniref:Saposin B-type domain-containing protein n=1 Tax=Perkinsus marinus (strain ATCC 50983 / TXsc) TaxID=423536 RepID=C5KTA5_PERM5|nr:hypothetical protein Pmar_PMAR001252 [Perkinsus marinus ATCC 50983]EER12455.1 hypothetical protein Pmar_PMAR001252 [Perkinsus marinus ATCC 50983]|eukprot:XP_002780660.1 hypothetical protein Pmar_PMAR001252 [Perkinsus marinus ATCC 50983]
MGHYMLLVTIAIAGVAVHGSEYPLAGIDVQAFVNSVKNEALESIKLTELPTLESEDIRGLQVSEKKHSPCEVCRKVNSHRLNKYFLSKIEESCRSRRHLPSGVQEFCRRFISRISRFDKELSGYLFQQVRVQQLAIAMCIGKEDCSPVEAFNPYFNPAQPDILTDVEGFCPTVSFEHYKKCVYAYSNTILTYSVKKVKAACWHVGRDHELHDFCEWFSADEAFGRGMVQALVPSYQHASFMCKQYSDHCRCRLG